ncbi:MAG: CRISPR-associated helicase Cas3' [Candidatus Lokiarchaeota archaeon]|nr:CRISPR-associated helicase Cas3' [Candidatus Lokiarchaeota archaeon]
MIMCEKDRILAKPYQTLIGHSLDSVRIYKYLFDNNKRIFEKLYTSFINLIKDTEQLNALFNKLNFSIFMELGFFLVYFHDLGKSTEEFQNYIYSKRSKFDIDKIKRVSHSYASFFYLISLLQKKEVSKELGFLLDIFIILIYPILGHHGQMNNNSFQEINRRKDQSIKVQDVKDFIYSFFEAFTILFEKQEKDSIFHFLKEIDFEQALFLLPDRRNRTVERLNEKMIRKFNNKTLTPYSMIEIYKFIHGFYYSLIKFCDETASAYYSVNESNLKRNEMIVDNLITSDNDIYQFMKQRKLDFVLNSFFSLSKNNPILPKEYSCSEIQKKIKDETNFRLLLRLGCGMGKTASSLLFAKNLAKRSCFKRIIFTLPTQFTSNSIVKDLEDEYGFNIEDIGLYHGNADEFWNDYFNGENDEDYNEEESNYIKKIKLNKAKTYSCPITVSTVDHLILTLIHGFKQADKSLSNILDSLVIFDELHYYELETLQIIQELQKILNKWNIPNIIMSGTMPDKVIEYYKNQNYEIYDWDGLFTINNEEKRKRIPYDLEVKCSSLFLTSNNGHSKLTKEFQSLLLNKFKIPIARGIKQIIFVNQVERAKILFHLITELAERENLDVDIIVYHSEFIKSDKIKKENIIKEKFTNYTNKTNVILISTQISEFSLNISSDVMYSELAPLDALFQRAGRLHRAGFRSFSKNCIELSKLSLFGACKKCESLGPTQSFNMHYNMYVFLPPRFIDTNKINKEKLEEELKKTEKRLNEKDSFESKNITYSSLPYNPDILLKSILLILENFGFSTDENLSFREICSLVSKLYNDVRLIGSVNFKNCFRKNLIFGDKPHDILFGDNPQIIIRPQKYLSYYVIPEKFHNKSLENLDDYSVAINQGKFNKIKKKFPNLESERGFFIIPNEIPYSSKIGFDFSSL